MQLERRQSTEDERQKCLQPTLDKVQKRRRMFPSFAKIARGTGFRAFAIKFRPLKGYAYCEREIVERVISFLELKRKTIVSSLREYGVTRSTIISRSVLLERNNREIK